MRHEVRSTARRRRFLSGEGFSAQASVEVHEVEQVRLPSKTRGRAPGAVQKLTGTVMLVKARWRYRDERPRSALIRVRGEGAPGHG